MADQFRWFWERDRLGRPGRRLAGQFNDDHNFTDRQRGEGAGKVFGETPKTAVETTAIPKRN